MHAERRQRILQSACVEAASRVKCKMHRMLRNAHALHMRAATAEMLPSSWLSEQSLSLDEARNRPERNV